MHGWFLWEVLIHLYQKNVFFTDLNMKVWIRGLDNLELKVLRRLFLKDFKSSKQSGNHLTPAMELSWIACLLGGIVQSCCSILLCIFLRDNVWGCCPTWSLWFSCILLCPIPQAPLPGEWGRWMFTIHLIWYLEKGNYLTPVQDGFRKMRSSADALLSLESSVWTAFPSQQHHVTELFDLEKSYDTTWHHGV